MMTRGLDGGGVGLGRRRHIGAGRWGWAVLPVLALALSGLGACGSSSAAPGGDPDAGTPVADGSVTDGPTGDAAVAIGTIVRGTPVPCTDAHTICVNATFPASMTVTPVRLLVDLYIDVPPAHPPDGIVMSILAPDIQPGETVQLRMTDLNLTATYHFLAVVFMPHGGFSLPVQAVDYTANVPMPYTFSGAPINIPDPLVFQFAP